MLDSEERGAMMADLATAASEPAEPETSSSDLGDVSAEESSDSGEADAVSAEVAGGDEEGSQTAPSESAPASKSDWRGADYRIPKSRFDQVNERMKAAEARVEEILRSQQQPQQSAEPAAPEPSDFDRSMADLFKDPDERPSYDGPVDPRMQSLHDKYTERIGQLEKRFDMVSQDHFKQQWQGQINEARHHYKNDFGIDIPESWLWSGLSGSGGESHPHELAEGIANFIQESASEQVAASPEWLRESISTLVQSNPEWLQEVIQAAYVHEVPPDGSAAPSGRARGQAPGKGDATETVEEASRRARADLL